MCPQIIVMPLRRFPGLGVDVLQILELIAPDLDGNGEVDAADSAELLSNWGLVPEGA